MFTELFTTLGHQAAILRAACADHRAEIARVEAVAEAEALRVETELGFCPWELPGTFPVYEKAKAKAEELREERGFWWAEARLTDLKEFVLHEGGQLEFVTNGKFGLRPWRLTGDLPEMHETVKEFVVKRAFGAAVKVGEATVLGF